MTEENTQRTESVANRPIGEPGTALVVATSLREGSASRRIAIDACRVLRTVCQRTVDFVDGKDLQHLPRLDDRFSESNLVTDLTRRVSIAEMIVLISPVYNWSTSALLKCFVEVTGTDETGRRELAWEDKVITFGCIAGTREAYLSWLPIANSLMLDYRCIINPFHLFATESETNGRDQDEEILSHRLSRTLEKGDELARLLRGRTQRSHWHL